MNRPGLTPNLQIEQESCEFWDGMGDGSILYLVVTRDTSGVEELTINCGTHLSIYNTAVQDTDKAHSEKIGTVGGRQVGDYETMASEK